MLSIAKIIKHLKNPSEPGYGNVITNGLMAALYIKVILVLDFGCEREHISLCQKSKDVVTGKEQMKLFKY